MGPGWGHLDVLFPNDCEDRLAGRGLYSGGRWGRRWGTGIGIGGWARVRASICRVGSLVGGRVLSLVGGGVSSVAFTVGVADLFWLKELVGQRDKVVVASGHGQDGVLQCSAQLDALLLG